MTVEAGTCDTQRIRKRYPREALLMVGGSAGLSSRFADHFLREAGAMVNRVELST